MITDQYLQIWVGFDNMDGSQFCAEMKSYLSFGTSHDVAVVHIGFKWYPGDTSITLQMVDNYYNYFLNTK